SATDVLEELVGLGRGCRLLEHALCATAEVAKVEVSLVDRLRHALGEGERVVEDDGRRRGVLAHVVEDRPLGASREARLRHSLDPDAGAASGAPLVARDRLERVDPVGPRPLAEAEEDHPVPAVRHAPIIARGGALTRRTCPRGSTAARTCTAW